MSQSSNEKLASRSITDEVEAPVRTVNIHEAKTQPSRLLDQAAVVEPFVIAKSSKPLVKVVPLDAPNVKRRIGFMAGDFEVPDDFDQMGADEIAGLFEGDP